MAFLLSIACGYGLSELTASNGWGVAGFLILFFILIKPNTQGQEGAGHRLRWPLVLLGLAWLWGRDRDE